MKTPLKPSERIDMKKRQQERWGKIIGERISERMRSANFSPTVLAVRAGISPTTVRNAINGKLLRLDCYYDIADALGISVAGLIQVPRKGLD